MMFIASTNRGVRCETGLITAACISDHELAISPQGVFS